MTKFILHGGETSVENENNRNFFKEIVKDLSRPHILIVYYARDKSDWPELLNGDAQRFKKANAEAIIELADEDIHTAIKQILTADVIYVRGGKTLKLYNKLKEIDSLKEVIKNKVVVGSSAGAFVLSKYFYSNDLKQMYEGLGILPVKVIAHYSKELESVYNKLIRFKEDLPIYSLRETEYKVVNV